MLNKDKKVVFNHLRAHEGCHAMFCTKQWFEPSGLSFKQFLREGYTKEELIRHSPPKRLAELEELLEFIEKNNLWDDENLNAWLERPRIG